MTLEPFLEAKKIVTPWIYETPLLTHEAINKKAGRRIFLKCENFQASGSFKARGCVYAMLKNETRPPVTRSSGNFGQAMAWFGMKCGRSVTIVMPETTPRYKVEKALQYGGEVILFGTTHAEGERKAAELVREKNGHYISPYDDYDVITGQGTIAFEIHDAHPNIKYLLCPIGGGSLTAGVSLVMHYLNPEVKVIAVEPEGAADYQTSRRFNQRTPLIQANTIADGLRTPCVGEKNWPILQKYTYDALTATDAEIIDAMRLLFEALGMVVEPSGAVALAAALKGNWNEDTAVILTGGNIDRKSFISFIYNCSLNAETQGRGDAEYTPKSNALRE